MSLKYISLSNTSHLNMLPHSMAGNTHFSEISSLGHNYASKVHGASNYLSVSKLNYSGGLQVVSMTDAFEKSEIIASETVTCNLNVNLSTEGSFMGKTFKETQSPGSCMGNDKIPAMNRVSITSTHQSKAESNASSKGNCSTREHSINKTANDTQSLESCPGKSKIPSVDVVSIVASNPSQKVCNGSSSERCSLNPNVSVKVKDSSPSKTETSRVLVEGCGFNDLQGDEDSSTASDISEQGSKVVVQKLSNVSCSRVSFLDSCFNISEILEKKPCEKKWCPENRIDFIKQSDESTRSSLSGKEEQTSDVIPQESLSSIASSKRKRRKNHEMNLHIRPGKGIRLRDNAYIVSNVENAQPSLLSFLHKVLFGSYGGIHNDDALSLTKQNILHFSGFSFSEDSEIFHTKRKCLSKVPYQMLQGLCNTLLGKGTRTRNDSVEDLLSFLQKPTNNSKSDQQLEINSEAFTESELSQWKQKAMKGPYPIIVVPKLSDSYVKELLQKMRSDVKADSSSKNSNMEKIKNYLKVTSSEYKAEFPQVQTIMDSETIQECDRPKNRIQLKALPDVVVRVNKARRRIINLLHTLLYGRPGSDESHRLNILEFSGFSLYDAKNYKRKKEFLKKLRSNDLDHMCSIFSLRIKCFSKMEKIIKLLHHLKVSSLIIKSKRITKLQPQNKRIIAKKTEVYSERRIKSYEQPVKKLKDFEKIRRNIECATPKDLTELNDLLFLKPSDNLDIHQQILEFSSLSFRENSPEFYSRRTLLYYMSFEMIKKMAALLEITDWEEYKNPQDLATTLLRFLMDMKPSVKICPRIKPRVHSLRRKIASPNTYRPHLLRVQRDDSGRENNMNGNLRPTSAIHNSTYVKDSFHEEKCIPDTSVIVRRISESSYSFTDTRTNEPVTVSDANSDESLSLYDFIKHPTDKQLEVTIREMIFTNTWSSTMGDLINRVFHCYPKLNLTYRVDFIKSKALEVLHEVQNNAELFDDMV